MKSFNEQIRGDYNITDRLAHGEPEYDEREVEESSNVNEVSADAFSGEMKE